MFAQQLHATRMVFVRRLLCFVRRYVSSLVSAGARFNNSPVDHGSCLWSDGRGICSWMFAGLHWLSNPCRKLRHGLRQPSQFPWSWWVTRRRPDMFKKHFGNLVLTLGGNNVFEIKQTNMRRSNSPPENVVWKCDPHAWRKSHFWEQAKKVKHAWIDHTPKVAKSFG